MILIKQTNRTWRSKLFVIENAKSLYGGDDTLSASFVRILINKFFNGIIRVDTNHKKSRLTSQIFNVSQLFLCV